MNMKILKSLVMVLMFSRISSLVTPEERCNISESGSVCMDCFRTGKCVANGDGTYTIQFDHVCPDSPSQSYCDDTVNAPQYFGSCLPIPPSYTNCSCSSNTQCIADLNNPAVVLHCESSPPVTDPPCPNSILDLTTCSCASCSDSCPLLDDPNDDCASYFFCSGSSFIQANCSNDLCFDQESCGCLKAGGSSSSSSTSSTTTTIPPLTCPEGCPFVDDPYNCSSYFICSGDSLIQVTCAQDLCFDQEVCGCVVREKTSTELSTTTEQIPPDCHFVDDPNDDCSSYFVFDGTILIPATCTGTLCYDPEACACVERESTTTETILTCPEGCPFVDDPKGVCGSYYICSGNDLIPVNCTSGFCFNQASCACVENGGSSSSTTTTPLTCPSGCPFVDDPNNCESYYFCNGDDLIAVNCSENFCFNQESCACVEKS